MYIKIRSDFNLFSFRVDYIKQIFKYQLFYIGKYFVWNSINLFLSFYCNIKFKNIFLAFYKTVFYLKNEILICAEINKMYKNIKDNSYLLQYLVDEANLYLDSQKYKFA